ncbi:MAG TPA: helix-turn-helix domain-containing protein, partial [Solirubrobacterales bacterium]|nr:helix-turn-helix domain-containing protein [Solirubrobacterales bacterium]
PDERLVLCLLAPLSEDADAAEAARAAARRLSVGQAIAATDPAGAALVASLGDPVLRTLGAAEIGAWLREVSGADVAVGESAAAGLLGLDEAHRQAALALRAARARKRKAAVAAWTELGADRLVAQLPAAALRDLPEGLVHLLREEPELVETLAVFLEAGGEIKATAAALSLHRSGLYYRLRRIEELSGLDLSRGDDRLLAHLAIRTEQMS